jgi:hypothetical protein
VQEGGTGTVCFGDAMGYIKKVGIDEEGLGCWCWILFGGLDGHNTRLIMAYNQCKNKNVNSGTPYQQQHRYFIMKPYRSNLEEGGSRRKDSIIHGP